MTFEDKKRENFERGNLELEKRRQALQEQQRKEQERLAALEREEQERKVSHDNSSEPVVVYQPRYSLSSRRIGIYVTFVTFEFVPFKGSCG